MSQDSNDHDSTRRGFLTAAAVVASAAALGLRPRLASAKSAALPHLSEKASVMAKSLGYEPKAAEVDRAKFSSYKPGERCAGCRFFQGTPGQKSGYAGCQIYPGFSVDSDGWCASFDARS